MYEQRLSSARGRLHVKMGVVLIMDIELQNKSKWSYLFSVMLDDLSAHLTPKQWRKLVHIVFNNVFYIVLARIIEVFKFTKSILLIL